MNRFSWSPKRCARVCAIVLTLSSFLFLFLMLSCPELKFDNTSCPLTNAQCCRNTYRPGRPITHSHASLSRCVSCCSVCDTNDPQKMFLSPCHFGCINQTVIASDNSTLYSSCNCASQATVSETACHFRRIPCRTDTSFRSLQTSIRACCRRDDLRSDDARSNARRLLHRLRSSSAPSSPSVQRTPALPEHGARSSANHRPSARSNHRSTALRLRLRPNVSGVAHGLLRAANLQGVRQPTHGLVDGALRLLHSLHLGHRLRRGLHRVEVEAFRRRANSGDDTARAGRHADTSKRTRRNDSLVNGQLSCLSRARPVCSLSKSVLYENQRSQAWYASAMRFNSVSCCSSSAMSLSIDERVALFDIHV